MKLHRVWSERRLGWVTAAALGGMLTALGPARAIDAEFPIDHVVVIAKSIDDVRVLIAPGDLSLLRGELVTSAYLDLPLAGLAPDQDINVYATALDTDWVGKNPSWETPWSKPGGDLDEAYARTMTLAGGKPAQRLSIDVTQMIRDIADSQAASNGFLLTAVADGREGFSAQEAAVIGNLGQAKLFVKYIKISALGYNEGSLSFINR